MKNYKVVGNERSALVLTPLAEKGYSSIDPLEIREYQTEDGYTYDIVGGIEQYDLTAEDVIEVCEQLAKQAEFDKIQAEMEDSETVEWMNQAGLMEFPENQPMTEEAAQALLEEFDDVPEWITAENVAYYYNLGLRANLLQDSLWY